MQEATLGILLGAGLAYYFQTSIQGKEKMNGVNEQIVLALEGSGIAVGFDADGDVTVNHVVTAICSMWDRLREAETSTRTLRRIYARTDKQRARAVLMGADLEAQLRDDKERHRQEFDNLARENNELARQLQAANNVLKRREEAAQDFLKMQRDKPTRAKKTRKKRRFPKETKKEGGG
jgi:hypothetical protein